MLKIKGLLLTMASVWTVISLSMAVSGCSDSAESIVPVNNDVPQHESPYSGEGVWSDKSGLGCDKVDYQMIVVDDHTYWVEVPMPCNPNPEIYKGDPGPDEGQRVNDNSVRNQIFYRFQEQRQMR
jgi:hypothetical protein